MMVTTNRFRLHWALGLAFLIGWAAHASPGPQQSSQRQVDEEAADYFQKWLQEDVVYIITREEKEVFEKLTTAFEKERFIEQFWTRRDPDPRTAENEFKVEHYRRIAFANERFASGYPGWLTDRGRIYILFGEPDEIESHSAGETYDRPLSEGGGTTQTYPYQKWRYRWIEGVGSDVELEFVDRTLSGEYRLAVLPDEKDAMATAGIGGPTLLERLELSKRRDRGTPQQELGFARERDSPFARFERYAKVLSPPEIRYNDLKEIVEVDAYFDELAFSTQHDYVRLDENRVLVLVTIQVAHDQLNFQTTDGVQTTRLAVYGVVTSLTKNIVYEFDDDIEARQMAGAEASVYQKVVPVDAQGHHKLTLVVKELESNKVGVTHTVIAPPAYHPDRLSGSSLILSKSITRVSRDEMFVIGDLKVRPNLTREFTRENPLGVYVQLYNVPLDSTTGAPALAVTYRIMEGDRVLFETTDSNGESIQFHSEARVVLARRFKLGRLEPGGYRVEVMARDLIRDEELVLHRNFRVVSP